MERYTKVALKTFAFVNNIAMEYLEGIYGPTRVTDILKTVVSESDNSWIQSRWKKCNDQIFWGELVDNLKKSGIVIKEWTEPFIDEDTGQIVDISRSQWRTIKKRKGAI